KFFTVSLLGNVPLIAFLFYKLFCCFFCCWYIFFFFQAEDGIRVRNVTGVQTCALPISPLSSSPVPCWPAWVRSGPARSPQPTTRSEERRVGKAGIFRCKPTR